MPWDYWFVYRCVEKQTCDRLWSTKPLQQFIYLVMAKHNVIMFIYFLCTSSTLNYNEKKSWPFTRARYHSEFNDCAHRPKFRQEALSTFFLLQNMLMTFESKMDKKWPNIGPRSPKVAFVFRADRCHWCCPVAPFGILSAPLFPPQDVSKINPQIDPQAKSW